MRSGNRNEEREWKCCLLRDLRLESKRSYRDDDTDDDGCETRRDGKMAWMRREMEMEHYCTAFDVRCSMFIKSFVGDTAPVRPPSLFSLPLPIYPPSTFHVPNFPNSSSPSLSSRLPLTPLVKQSNQGLNKVPTAQITATRAHTSNPPQPSNTEPVSSANPARA